jgi:ABC-type sugar transport system substrate-binding protein
VTLKQFIDRYGATLVVVTVLVLLVALLPGNAPDRTTELGAGPALDTQDTTPGAEGSGTDVASAGGSTGGTGGGAAGGGGASGGRLASGGGSGAKVEAGKGPNCRPDGRMKGISLYAPPCVSFSGDNGGATAKGVTKDKILVIRYLLPIDPATQATLQGAKLADPQEVVKRAYEGLRRYANNHVETYGREIVLQDFQASGDDTNDEAMKADALKIANDIKAFAVIEGNPAAVIPTIFGKELAARGVICICTTSLTNRFYQENNPYIFSSLPTATEFGAQMAEYIAKRLNGKPAKFAGDELNPAQGYKTTNRKFGLIYIVGNEGRVDQERVRNYEDFIAELAKRGIRLTAEASYIYDPGRNQQDVTSLILKMKQAGVTTVIPMVDPLYPIIITGEATRQQYYPEWLILGFGLSDTTAAGRLYDQLQWRHAFGISPLWVTWAHVNRSGGYRAFHHGMPGMRPGDEGVLINIYATYFAWLSAGIHMAGPNLTADTFAKGMYSYPRTGGDVGHPTVQFSRSSPTAVEDFIEIWWAADAQGPDERSEQGTGMMMKSDGGKRYAIGQWPQADTKAFVPAGAIGANDDPPGAVADPQHEQDGHTHNKRCLSCSG